MESILLPLRIISWAESDSFRQCSSVKGAIYGILGNVPVSHRGNLWHHPLPIKQQLYNKPENRMSLETQYPRFPGILECGLSPIFGLFNAIGVKLSTGCFKCLADVCLQQSDKGTEAELSSQ